MGSSFVMVLAFPSCLQDGCSSTYHCVLHERSEGRMRRVRLFLSVPLSFIKRENILSQNYPPEPTSPQILNPRIESPVNILGIRETRKVHNWYLKPLGWEASSNGKMKRWGNGFEQAPLNRCPYGFLMCQMGMLSTF